MTCTAADILTHYRASVANILALRAGSKTFMQMPGGQVDGFQTSSGIDTTYSANYFYDARKVVTPTRSGSSTVGDDDCNTLSGWTDMDSGSGSTTVITSSDPDPMIGKVFRFSTGTTAGSVAKQKKDFGSIPSSFGAMFISKLTAVGTAAGDALFLSFENIDNVELRIRLIDNQIAVFIDGTWLQLFAPSGGGGGYREHWFEVTKLSSSSWRVDLLLGTEIVGTATGVLPAGTSTNGLVTITQGFTSSNNRVSEIALINIGTTQLPDDMSLVGVDRYNMPGGLTDCFMVLLIEYTAGEQIVLNTDIQAWLSPNGHGAYENVALVDGGRSKIGVIDDQKWVHVLYGTRTFTGTTGTNYKSLISTFNGKYIAVLGVDYLAW